MKLHLSLALAVSLSAVACGGATIPPPSHAKLESSQDEVSRYRGALAQIKANHNAKSAASDITRAEEWLDTAKQISADNGSTARLRLYLDAVHAQLVMVQSHFAREEARKSAGMKDKDADHASESEGDDESIHAPNHTQAARGAAHSDRNDSNGDDL